MERTDPVNWSTLKYILTSPRHYRHTLATPRPDTDAMRLGRLTHTMVYEPEEVASRHPIMPRFHGGMKDENAIAKGYDGGKEAKAAWGEEHGDNENVVTAEQFGLAAEMTNAVQTDPTAAPLVHGGYSEQSITWTDDLTGIECRGRVDHINGRLSDLKTARDVVPRIFRSQAARLHYFGQLAFYYDGCMACGLTFDHDPAIIAVENHAPYDVVVFQFGPEDLAAGRRAYRRALHLLHECRLTDIWPGIGGGASVPAGAPEWYGGASEPMVLTMGGEEVEL